jgi:hypothetical protein
MDYNCEIPSENENLLRFDNERIKKLLVEEYDACFPDLFDENNLPPEIENQFLNRILLFEKEYKTVNSISVYDYLGEPEFKLAKNLSDNEITKELGRMTKLLNDQLLSLDTLCEVPERELYRFLTEELLFEQIDDMHIPGMITHFTYEEFHPNHKYDIQNHSDEFFEFYLNLEHTYYLQLLTIEAEKSDWHSHFRKAFSQFHLETFSITEIVVENESAVVQFECDFTGRIEGGRESLRFVGAGEMQLLYQNEYWCIDAIKLPSSKFCDVRTLS